MNSMTSNQTLTEDDTTLSTNGSTSHQPITPLVSYYVYTIFMFVLGVSLTNILALFGIVSNTANIIVYYKMGLTETTNISFFTLAINDLLNSLATIVVEITQSPLMKLDEQPPGAIVRQVSFLASFVVYFCCGLGAWMTAILSTDRCLCIALPLKVKSIITTRRIGFLIGAMASYQFSGSVLIVIRTGPPYDITTPERAIYVSLIYIIPTMFCFPIVSVSTAFLIFRLKQTRTWRETAVRETKTDSTKEKKVARSVVFICSIFIICFFPNVLTLSFAYIYDRFRLADPYMGWLARIFYVFTFFFQTVNSSLNIFVYYSMSTRYREALKALVSRSK